MVSPGDLINLFSKGLLFILQGIPHGMVVSLFVGQFLKVISGFSAVDTNAVTIAPCQRKGGSQSKGLTAGGNICSFHDGII